MGKNEDGELKPGDSFAEPPEDIGDWEIQTESKGLGARLLGGGIVIINGLYLLYLVGNDLFGGFGDDSQIPTAWSNFQYGWQMAFGG